MSVAASGWDRRPRAAATGLPGVTGVDLVAVALVAALIASAIRVPLLWDDVWPPGYDGWYYVLQVRSILEGRALFGDQSLVYPLLAVLGWVFGDVIVGNKVAVCLFAAVGAGGAAVGASRWTGSMAAGLVAGLWWATAPGHLFVSTEFLKNEGGLALLGLLLAVLPGCERRASAWGAAIALAVVGVLVHKLTGLFGLVLLVGYGGMRGLRGRLSPWVVLGGAVALVLAVVAFGLLRPVDLQRFWPDIDVVSGQRWSLLWGSPRLSTPHRIALGLAHVVPLGLVAVLLGPRGEGLRDLGVPLVLLSVATTALFLPFGFDLTSWRLLLLAFVPTAFLGAALIARTTWSVAIVPTVLALGHLWITVPHQTLPEPDYEAWSDHIPTLQAHIPPGDRVVAHRGLCGFVYGAADRPCENFDPQGSPEGWWRIAFGQSAEALAPYSPVEPVPLRPAYVLVPESAWRRFREAHGERNPYVRHPMNPFRARPAFVYGPRDANQEDGT